MMKNEKVVEKLKLQIKQLNEEIAKLIDENQSLWDMLEEITASDIKNWSETLQKEHEKIKFDKLMITKKMGNA
jgi:FPC/CPF motif-containing protein YcgG